MAISNLMKPLNNCDDKCETPPNTGGEPGGGASNNDSLTTNYNTVQTNKPVSFNFLANTSRALTCVDILFVLQCYTFLHLVVMRKYAVDF